jgi:hypothetical protein
MKCTDCHVDWHAPDNEITEEHCEVGICTKMVFHCCSCRKVLKVRMIHNRQCQIALYEDFNEREDQDDD